MSRRFFFNVIPILFSSANGFNFLNRRLQMSIYAIVDLGLNVAENIGDIFELCT